VTGRATATKSGLAELLVPQQYQKARVVFVKTSRPTASSIVRMPGETWAEAHQDVKDVRSRHGKINKNNTLSQLQESVHESNRCKRSGHWSEFQRTTAQKS
jgi:hypothetical protein